MITKTNKPIQLNPIGTIHTANGEFKLKINEAYREGLKELNQFSHVIVIWWASEHDNEKSRSLTTTQLPYADNKEAGVFACRSEYRPNPVAITTCACLDIDMDNGIITIPYIDAFDKSPIIDLKAYFPVLDRVRDFKVPQWVEGWPEWVEEAYKLAEMFADCD